jgi:membrane protease YdiL (CAAX protease family)
MAQASQKENLLNRFNSSISLGRLFEGESRKATIILLSAPVILTTFRYYGTEEFYLYHLASGFRVFGNEELASALYTFSSSLILLGLLPALVIKFVFREPLSHYGVRLGDWRWGLKAFLILAPVMIALTFPSSRMGSFRVEYPFYKGAGGSPSHFVFYSLLYGAYYVGWEFFFRGYMQFGLGKRLGDWNAILVQTLASCLVHICKPDAEIYSSILGGIVWGMVVFRTRSLLPALMLHWLLGISLDVFIIYL